MFQSAGPAHVIYYSQAESNKMLRAALKAAFPGVKFRVAGSGGSSTNVGWVDGPSEPAVKEISEQFEGASFDGMIDLESSVYHVIDGQRVHYGSRYIFTNREFSDEIMAEAKEFAQAAGVDFESGQWQTYPHSVWVMDGDGYSVHYEAAPQSIQLHVAAEFANRAYAAK